MFLNGSTRFAIAVKQKSKQHISSTCLINKSSIEHDINDTLLQIVSVRAAHGDEYLRLVPDSTTKTTINMLFQRAACKAPALPQAGDSWYQHGRGRDVGVTTAPAWDSPPFNPSVLRLPISVFRFPTSFRPNTTCTLVAECRLSLTDESSPEYRDFSPLIIKM